MNEVLQFLGTFASIVSVPLAVYFYYKTANITCDKARNDIIKAVSYKIGVNQGLSATDLIAVYRSKLREHKIHQANFTVRDIIDDLKTDIMSNPFLENASRNQILSLLDTIERDITRMNSNNKQTLTDRIIKVVLYSPLPIILLIIATFIGVIVSILPYISHMIGQKIMEIEDIRATMSIPKSELDELSSQYYIYRFFMEVIDNPWAIFYIISLIILTFILVIYWNYWKKHVK